MFTKVKFIASRYAMTYVLKKTKAPCSCISCMKIHKEDNLIPCVCPKLNLPCLVLKSKYSSTRALSELISTQKSFLYNDSLVIPFDINFINTKYLNLLESNSERIINNEGK